MLVILNNETTATEFFFNMPKSVYEHLLELGDDLSLIFPKISPSMMLAHEAPMHLEALRDYCMHYELIKDRSEITLEPIPQLFFESGWASRS